MPNATYMYVCMYLGTVYKWFRYRPSYKCQRVRISQTTFRETTFRALLDIYCRREREERQKKRNHFSVSFGLNAKFTRTKSAGSFLEHLVFGGGGAAAVWPMPFAITKWTWWQSNRRRCCILTHPTNGILVQPNVMFSCDKLWHSRCHVWQKRSLFVSVERLFFFATFVWLRAYSEKYVNAGDIYFAIIYLKYFSFVPRNCSIFWTQKSRTHQALDPKFFFARHWRVECLVIFSGCGTNQTNGKGISQMKKKMKNDATTNLVLFSPYGWSSLDWHRHFMRWNCFVLFYCHTLQNSFMRRIKI